MSKLSLILAFTLAFSLHFAEARSLRKVKRTGITFGVRKGNAPLGIQKNKERKGIEYEIAASLAKSMGIRFRLIYLNSVKEGEEKLLNNKIDALLTQYRKTKKNKSKFLFSTPYAKTNKSILTLKSNKEIFSVRDLEGQYVAVTAESKSQDLIEKHAKKAKVEMVRSYKNAGDMLKSGEVQAIVGETLFLKNLARKNGNFKVLELALGNDEYHIASNKNYKKLAKSLNSHLEKLNTSSSKRAPSPLGDIFAKYDSKSGVSQVVDASLAPAVAEVAPTVQKQVSAKKEKKQKRSSSKNKSKKEKIKALLIKIEDIKYELIQLQKEL